jgi:acyl-CoA synthetase (AMP-forming)/AMP-acid ligase II
LEVMLADALIQYTSGTTGRLEGAPFTHYRDVATSRLWPVQRHNVPVTAAPGCGR